MGFYWFKRAMGHSFTVDGRARRLELFAFIAFAVTFSTAFVSLGLGLMMAGFMTVGVVMPCLSFIFIPALLSALIRRLHDVGRNGVWLSTLLFPVILLLLVTGFPDFAARSDKAFSVLLLCSAIGPIYILVFMLQDSVDDNIYGFNPKSM